MFTFKPAVYRSSTLYELPRPITTLRLQEAWDFDQFKILLQDGDHLAGHSRQGIDISLEGQIALQAGTLRLTEEEMFDELEALRTSLHIGPEDSKYELFLYHDADTDTFRKFKSVSTLRLETDLSDKHLFTWSALLHAENPTIYTTAPGS